MKNVTLASALALALLFLTSHAMAAVYMPGASIETYDVTGAKEGTPINLYAKVKNTGDMDLPGSSTCAVKFWIIGEGLNKHIGSVGCDLVVGRQKSYKVSWTPTKAGTYTYYAAVELTDAYGHKSLLTNWVHKKFTVSKKAVASASLVSFSVSGDGVVGGSLFSRAVVRNVGGV
ncbi:MAG: hypothetical protein JW724_03920, partial [Candidatus Altiarchaeota archaeon]|nr:hypothetical protein [Candidatus Altiarchaeota archaeon]